MKKTTRFLFFFLFIYGSIRKSGFFSFLFVSFRWWTPLNSYTFLFHLMLIPVIVFHNLKDFLSSFFHLNKTLLVLDAFRIMLTAASQYPDWFFSFFLPFSFYLYILLLCKACILLFGFIDFWMYLLIYDKSKNL